ncbi:MAG: acyl-CoA desaturase [Deltaproteobacteria bacterium]|nr:acyl-CoA desaturase [Deltaproteobacteria bacterium]
MNKKNLFLCIPFISIHLIPLAAFWTGTKPLDWILCGALYVIRMFFITAGYHRYFAHRTFKTNRFFQFLLAFGGGTAGQKGALWWAGHHRHHHRYSDQEADIHSPKKGFWWSHMGWFLSDCYQAPRYDLIKDFAKYPELRFLDKWHWIPMIVLGAIVLAVSGLSGLLIGFFLSTLLVLHSTFCINSLAHVWGKIRYKTTDTSRNNFILGLLTLGEGWHNNHHHFPASVRQGFFWWEIDLSFYALKFLEKFKVVKDLKLPTAQAMVKDLVHVNKVPKSLRPLYAESVS